MVAGSACGCLLRLFRCLLVGPDLYNVVGSGGQCHYGPWRSYGGHELQRPPRRQVGNSVELAVPVEVLASTVNRGH